MNFLVITYNIKEPFACYLSKEGEKKIFYESSFYRLNDPYKTFPENSIKEILSFYEINALIFLGKPFAYLKNMIDLHLFLFPYSFASFMTDIKNFFTTILEIPDEVYKAGKILKNPANYIKDNIYYIGVDQIIANNYFKKFSAPLVLNLSHVFEGSLFQIYKQNSKQQIYVEESSGLNQWGQLIRIFNEHQQKVNLKEFINAPLDTFPFFTFKKKYFENKGNTLSLKYEYLPKNNEDFDNIPFLSNIFNKIKKHIFFQYDKINYIHDIKYPETLISESPELVFRYNSWEETIVLLEEFIKDHILNKRDIRSYEKN